MSVMLGGASLPDPGGTGADGHTEEMSELLDMCDGSRRKHLVGSARKVWTYTWVRYNTQAAVIQTAIEAAIAAGSATFRPWDEVMTYTVEVMTGSHRWSTRPVSGDRQWTISAQFREL